MRSIAPAAARRVATAKMPFGTIGAAAVRSDSTKARPRKSAAASARSANQVCERGQLFCGQLHYGFTNDRPAVLQARWPAETRHQR
jgi:hypothetical protein